MDDSVEGVTQLNTVAGHSQFGSVQLKSGIKEDIYAQKCLFGMNLGHFRLPYARHYNPRFVLFTHFLKFIYVL